MRERVAVILRHDIREIIGSPLIVELLDIYSKLYLHGAQPGYCERCIRDYWSQLNSNGMELAERFQQLKKRTLVPAWNGLKYVPRQARHFDSENITDQEAIDFIEKGQLRESDFTKLPEGYKSKSVQEIPKGDEQKTDIPLTSEPVKEIPVKKTSKPRKKRT